MAQQVADSGFRFGNAKPAFVFGEGPRVCIDVAHNNFQSAARNPGAYQPLVALLRGDGYRVSESQATFSSSSLERCDVLVIATPSADANIRNWALPHPSAFTSDEIVALDTWVRKGGGLLIIADHTPSPGAASDLGQRLGVVVLDGGARLGSDTLPDVFARNRGELVDHPILRGRDVKESVDSLATFFGHAFLASRDWSALLKFRAGSTGSIPSPDVPRAEWPQFSIDGWMQGAARRLGKGRVVWLGEVSICTALRGRVGMNHPSAGQNAQFCLNVHRWLSGLLEA